MQKKSGDATFLITLPPNPGPLFSVTSTLTTQRTPEGVGGQTTMSRETFLERMYSRSGAASSAECYQRRLLTLVAGIQFTAATPMLMTAAFAGTGANMALAASISMVSPLALFVYMCTGREVTRAGIVVFLYAMGVSIFLNDLETRLVAKTVYPMLVIVVDLLLVLQVGERFTLIFVVVSVMWILLLSAENVFRMGLYDIAWLRGQSQRREFYDDLVSCATLPCPIPFASEAFLLLAGLMVFIVDFIATRGFARQVLKEQTSMQKTIEAVHEIASLLAKYDVEGVARMLKMREAELPEQMYETLQTMERNLRMYRPYLPAALFDEMEDEGSRVSFGPPGVESETATIVFTDIRSSTTIWEHAPEGMRAGLKIHNSVMREVMQAFGGYEVKTIGDAFMIAFASTQDGVNFGLRVHELLREAVWPESLLEDAPICTEQGSLWGGLTVRIGVNTGPVTVEQNALTGRTDYFGHTVNVAARVESTCKPGAVAVPSDLWEACCMCCDAAVGDVESLELKGVSEPVDMRCLWPLSLAGRKYTPLEAGLLPTGDTVMDFTGQTLCETLAQARYSAAATIGVVQVSVNSPDHGSALHDMNIGIAALTVALDQSGGALVSLLGSRVCVGWNLTRATQAHAENAVRFVQRLHDGTSVAGAGLASGPVEHGDVGTRIQRFMTVMGPSVHRSWTLCEEAVDEGKVCLYEPPQGTALPASLAKVLRWYRFGLYECAAWHDDTSHTSIVTPQVVLQTELQK